MNLPSLGRRRLMQWALALLIVPLAVNEARGADWVARHGLSAAQYQREFTKQSKRGLRLISVSGYERKGQAHYAAVWAKRRGPAWAARHGMTAAQYQRAFDDYAKKGYRLTYVNGYSVRGRAYYAAIWDKRKGPAWSARHGMTTAQYQKAVTDMTKKKMTLKHVSAFSVRGSPRFAAIFERGGPAWVARHGLTAAAYQKAFDRFTRQGYRLKVVSGYADQRQDLYAAIWEKGRGPLTTARHGIRERNYQATFDNYTYQSYRPTYVEAFNARGEVRFNGLWQNRSFSAADLTFIEKRVRRYMRKHKVPGLSLAISRDEKLVYASAFGYADKERRDLAGPADRFRVASVSKPITAVAIQKVIEKTTLTEKSRVFGSSGVLASRFKTPARNRKINKIEIGHLLRHQGGFVNVNKDGEKRDPMFAYSGTGHTGLIKWTLKNYPLGYDPGTDDQYSNFGYCLLGRVIERMTDKTYERYVRDAILKPAGARGMVIGGDKLKDRKRNEVKYYGDGAYSAVKPQRFDSHGGWIATPIDLLRFLKHEDALRKSYAHYGRMGGTVSVLRRTSDGFGLAVVANISADEEAMNAMIVDIKKKVKSWPSVDLF